MDAIRREPERVEHGEWIMVRLTPIHPVEVYWRNGEGLEVFSGYLHRYEREDLRDAWFAAMRERS